MQRIKLRNLWQLGHNHKFASEPTCLVCDRENLRFQKIRGATLARLRIASFRLQCNSV